MLKEILGIVEKAGARPLLIVLGAVALSTFIPGGGPLADPICWQSFLLPVLVISAYVLFGLWETIVDGLNARLEDNDVASWGPFLGCSMLAFCLVVTLWYLSWHTESVSFALLGKPGFVRLCALYLFAVETVKIGR